MNIESVIEAINESSCKEDFNFIFDLVTQAIDEGSFEPDLDELDLMFRAARSKVIEINERIYH